MAYLCIARIFIPSPRRVWREEENLAKSKNKTITNDFNIIVDLWVLFLRQSHLFYGSYLTLIELCIRHVCESPQLFNDSITLIYSSLPGEDLETKQWPKMFQVTWLLNIAARIQILGNVYAHTDSLNHYCLDRGWYPLPSHASILAERDNRIYKQNFQDS